MVSLRDPNHLLPAQVICLCSQHIDGSPSGDLADYPCVFEDRKGDLVPSITFDCSITL